MNIQTKIPPSKRPVAAVISYNGLTPFEFGIAEEVFNLPRPEFDFPWYEFKVVAGEKRKARGRGGLVVEADAGLKALATAQTIIIPGWRDRAERPPQNLLNALVTAHDNGARILSICSGVFVLAAAGLLDGKRATTHWQHTRYLKENFPKIIVEEDVLYVDEGGIISSAGSAAGIDAAIHLVRQDFGSQIANKVAKRLVMAPHRDGGQAQYVCAPVFEGAGRSISLVMAFARNRLDKTLKLSDLAGHAGMSERTFLRRFGEAVGMTPLTWLQHERMYRAREILEQSESGLAEIAENCGYRSLETFRVSFKRLVGTSPGAYRNRFKCGVTHEFNQQAKK